ncbi:MAG: von Willebrand factor type [Edaphobacter sp.]|nr:von Willebrand factor type [Edaphobacter sp.]
MKVFFRIAAVVLASIGCPQGFAQEQAVSLDFLTKPTLIECEPQSAEPCFRMKFNFVDAAGKPVNVQLPPADQLASHVEIQIDGQNVKPFYAAATAGTPDQATPPQTALLLFDVSGSMLKTDLGGQSRFDAAKGAAAEYLKNFSDGQDLVAIVPFASRDVESTIAAAHFVSTRAAAEAELDALPRPEARNNTALYSAVRAAVDVLRQQHRSGAGQPRLLLLTDGANDVHPQSGDDQGLLAGAGGLATAAAAVQQSGFDVLPIGLGDRHSIDEITMARLGTRPPLITLDVNDLRKAFQLVQFSQDGSLTVAVQAPESLGSRTMLVGQIVHFRAKVTLPDGSVRVENRQALWVAPPIATPSFEGEATEIEQRAFLANARLDRGSPLLFLRPFFVFAGFAALLAILWFGPPRLLWPDRYDNRVARPVRPEYWPGAELPSRREGQSGFRQAPPGFEAAARGARAPMRSPGEHTIVQAVAEFDPNKTRLS